MLHDHISLAGAELGHSCDLPKMMRDARSHRAHPNTQLTQGAGQVVHAGQAVMSGCTDLPEEGNEITKINLIPAWAMTAAWALLDSSGDGRHFLKPKLPSVLAPPSLLSTCTTAVAPRSRIWTWAHIYVHTYVLVKLQAWLKGALESSSSSEFPLLVSARNKSVSHNFCIYYGFWAALGVYPLLLQPVGAACIFIPPGGCGALRTLKLFGELEE